MTCRWAQFEGMGYPNWIPTRRLNDNFSECALDKLFHQELMYIDDLRTEEVADYIIETYENVGQAFANYGLALRLDFVFYKDGNTIKYSCGRGYYYGAVSDTERQQLIEKIEQW